MSLHHDIEGMAVKVHPIANVDGADGTYELALNWIDAVRGGSLELITSNDHEARRIFVGLQALIEKVIAEKMAKGEIESAVNIIHTPKPVSPFSAAEDDGGYKSTEAFAEALRVNPDAEGYVKLRRKVLSEFMMAGGVVVSAYPKGQELSEAYEGNLEAFDGSLIDRPLDDFDPALTGATLVVTEKNGLTTLFSLNAYQAHTANDGQTKTWRVQYGNSKSPHAEALQERFDTVNAAVTGQDDADSVYWWKTFSQNAIERALG